MSAVARRTQVIAYNYPGWHRSRWKDMDEWCLLDERRPTFDGHQPLLTPARGRYDDREPGVVRGQIQEARSAGIDAFTYFLYFGRDGFVLDEPTRRALDEAEATEFSVGVTWCLRQPYRSFPVELPDERAGAKKPAEATPDFGSTALSELVPDALLDTPVTALIAVCRPTAKPPRTRRGARMFHRQDDITLSQVIDFVTEVRDVSAETPALELSMDVVERALGRLGFLDLPLSTVLTLIRDLDVADPGTPGELRIGTVVDAFSDHEARLTPADVRYLAALGGELAAELDVFKSLQLNDLTAKLTPQGLAALSCRDVRALLEGIAVDRLAAGRR